MTTDQSDKQSSTFECKLHRILMRAWDPQKKAFDPRKFFTHWFKAQGKPLFFLFKKNLSQSNIQFAELLALIRTHMTRKMGGQHVHELQFLAINEFIEGFSSMVAAFKGQDADSDSRTIAQLYAGPLSRLVLVEPHFGSATIFIPPHLKLDHQRVCGEAGYIHSCGANVFTHAIDGTNPQELIAAIEAHVKKNKREGKKVFFTVYAHEDFTDYDRALASELRGGLDEVKVHVEKYHVGKKPLVAVLNELQNRLKDYLVIPEPGDFRRQHKKARKRNDLDNSRTLWLIIDRGLGPSPQVPGSERSLICYDQDVHNGNPFHHFDENKPAWVSHTTIPHTLAGAMVNITRPWLGHDRDHLLQICDPFGGTGTVCLEAAKLECCKADSSDLEPITPLLVRDNLLFFSAPLTTLKKARQHLQRVIRLLSSEKPLAEQPNGTNKAILDDMAWTGRQYAKLAQGATEDIAIAPSVARAMAETHNIFRRLLLYVALRTRVRHVNHFKRGVHDENIAFTKEAQTLVRQFDDLISQREREQKGAKQLGRLQVFQGSYSKSCGISCATMTEMLRSNIESVCVRSACDVPADTYDVIVTDPPYGFNTEEDQTQLAEVYALALRAIVRSLRDRGQLVICLPARSHTGRKLPAFTTPGFVTQQVLAEAEAMNREVILPAQALPTPGSIFRPPFYWESERALRRVILHFRFRGKPTLT